MAALLVYVDQVELPLILYWNSLVPPPEPPVKVAVPELYPAQIMLPLTGDADNKVGEAGVASTVTVAVPVIAVVQAGALWYTMLTRL